MNGSVRKRNSRAADLRDDAPRSDGGATICRTGVLPSNDNGFNLSAALAPAAGLTHVACTAWTIAQEPGVLLPPPFVVVHVAAITVLASSHMARHLGVRNACLFVSWCVVAEWTCEQLNALYDGFIFGRLVYSNQIGPKLGDVPLVVPFAFASLVWPSVVIVSLLLHDTACYLPTGAAAGESCIRTAARSALIAMVHTAWSPSVEPLAIKIGAMTYLDTQKEHAGSLDPRGPVGSFLFVPMTEIRGWFFMAFGMVFSISLAFGRLGLKLPPPAKLSLATDSAPLVLFGMFAVWLAVKPLDNIGGLFSLFTMMFSVAMAAYKLTMLDSRMSV